MDPSNTIHIEACTQAQFHYWLDLLSPLGWTCLDGSESFMITPPMVGGDTTIYVRIGRGDHARHYYMLGDISMRHPEIVQTVFRAEQS